MYTHIHTLAQDLIPSELFNSNPGEALMGPENSNEYVWLRVQRLNFMSFLFIFSEVDKCLFTEQVLCVQWEMKTDGNVIFLFYGWDVGTPKVQATAPSWLPLYSLHRFRSQCSKLSLLDAYLLSSRRPLIGEYKQIMQGALETWSLILSASEDFQES